MSEPVWQGKHLAVVVRDGKEIVVHGPAVAIVAVDTEHHVWLVRQPRAGAAGTKLLELPAGNVDDGEEPLAAARRELAEETGLHGGEWVEAASFYSSPGFCDERIHLFIARGLERGEATPEGSEEIEHVVVPAADVAGRLYEVEDGKTLAGLLLYLHEYGPRG